MRPVAAACALSFALTAKAADPAPVLLLDWEGGASPVACLQKGALVPGMKCKGLVHSRDALRTDDGAVLQTGKWKPDGALCPWSAGPADDRKLQLGSLALCSGDAPCEDSSPPKLAVPARSKVKLWPRRTLDAKRFPDAKEQAALAALAGKALDTLELGDGFEVDLDGDGKPDRLVELVEKRTKAMRRTQQVHRYVFLWVEGAAPKPLAQAGCAEPDFVGASDLDGDGKPELVFRFQYQVILFRNDGTVLVENAECCGEG